MRLYIGSILPVISLFGLIGTHTYSAATTGAAGLMSAADKTKLDGIAADANAYALPTASTTTLGGVKVDGSTVTISNGVLSAAGGGSFSPTITNAEENQVLTYNGTSWVNADPYRHTSKTSGGYVGYAGKTHSVESTLSMPVVLGASDEVSGCAILRYAGFYEQTWGCGCGGTSYVAMQGEIRLTFGRSSVTATTVSGDFFSANFTIEYDTGCYGTGSLRITLPTASYIYHASITLEYDFMVM